jgi:hydroxypyruvate isomerase
MNRRDFARNVAGAALGPAALKTAASGNSAVKAAVPQGEAPGVPFKLSVMLWTVFQKLPFEQRLEKVSQAGYKYVELVGAEYRKWSEDDFRKANAKRRELGITFDTTAGLAHSLGDPSQREAFLADLRNELPIMDKIECPSIIVMSGNVVEDMAREQQHQSCVEGLKRAVELVQGKNVVLLLENIDPEENPKYYLTSVAEGFKIIEAVNHPQAKFCYDFFHEQISEGNLIEKLEKNIDKVGLVHIADVPGRHEPGTGEINYENIFRTLARLKYDRVAAMEFLPTGDAVQSLRAAREMAIRAGQSRLLALPATSQLSIHPPLGSAANYP